MQHRLKEITDQELSKLCAESTSYKQVVEKIGYTGGSGFEAIKHRIAQSKIDVSHFTGQTWNKGRTKENHPSIAKFAKTLSLKLKGKPGHKPSFETKEKLSRSRIHYLETHPNHGLKWYQVPCGDHFENVQGTWEKKVAEWLNNSNILWERKTLRFLGHRRYTPDFFLPDHDFYIEVKGFWRDRDVHKMYLVLDENDVDIRYVDKTNLSNLTLNLPKFVDRFKRQSIDVTNFNNIWSCDEKVDM